MISFAFLAAFGLIFFDEVKGDGVGFIGMAKFKKKLAKFLVEADPDLVSFFL